MIWKPGVAIEYPKFIDQPKMSGIVVSNLRIDIISSRAGVCSRPKLVQHSRQWRNATVAVQRKVPGDVGRGAGSADPVILFNFQDILGP